MTFKLAAIIDVELDTGNGFFFKDFLLRESSLFIHGKILYIYLSYCAFFLHVSLYVISKRKSIHVKYRVSCIIHR